MSHSRSAEQQPAAASTMHNHEHMHRPYEICDEYTIEGEREREKAQGFFNASVLCELNHHFDVSCQTNVECRLHVFISVRIWDLFILHGFLYGMELIKPIWWLVDLPFS